MKKLMMTLAAGLFATAVVAEVTSANVVGYYSPVLSNGYNMVAFNFEMVDGSTNGIDIQDLFKIDQTIYTAGTTRMSASTLSTSADEVRIWNAAASAYDNYFLYRIGGGTATTRNFKWVAQTNSAVIATAKIKSGQAVWYNARNAAGVALPAFSGQVPSSNSVAALPLSAGYNMICAGFTDGWVLNKPSEGGYDTSYWSGLYAATKVAASTLSTSADEIRIWDTKAQAYQNYFLYRIGGGTATTRNFLWVAQTNPAVIADVTINVDKGVWYNSRKTGVTITPKVPYALE
jgi:hypothetical protein